MPLLFFLVRIKLIRGRLTNQVRIKLIRESFTDQVDPRVFPRIKLIRQSSTDQLDPYVDFTSTDQVWLTDQVDP